MGGLTLAFIAAGWIQQPPLIPRKVLLTESILADVQMSPDGRAISFVSYAKGGKLMLHEPRKELVPDVVVRRYVWLQDSKTLLVAGNQGEQTVLKLVPKDGVSKDVALPAQTQISFLATSPKLPGHFAIALSTPDQKRNGLYKVSLADGKWQKLDDNQGFNRWFLDADLQPVAGSLTGPESVNLFVKDRAKGWQSLANYSPVQPPMAGIAGVSADGRRVFYVGNDDSDTSVLREFDLESGAKKLLHSDPQVDIISQSVFCSPRTLEPLWAFGYLPRAKRGVLRPDLGRHFDSMSKLHPGDVSVVGMSNDEKRWLVRFLNGTPINYFIYDTESGKLERLFSDTPQLDGLQLAQRTGFQVAAKDGLQLPVDVYLPPGSDSDKDGKPDKPLPTILFVHGGPWVGFDWNFWLQVRHHQLLANRGYAVIKTEFRSTPGYGKKFMDLGDREWGGKMNQDLLDITEWAVQNKIADKSKVGIWGGSYGGYATLAALTFSPDVFACGASVYGVSDILPTDPSSLGFHPFWRQRVGDPTTPEGQKMLRERSPLNFADRVKAPVLISHGLMDNRVPPSQSQRMVDRLRELGKPVTYLTFAEDGHDFMQPGTWEAFWSVAEGFFAEHLGGRAEPAGDELEAAKGEIR